MPFGHSTFRSAAHPFAPSGRVGVICHPAALRGTLRRQDTQVIYINQQLRSQLLRFELRSRRLVQTTMAKSNSRGRPRTAAPKDDISEVGAPAAGEPFPPLTISLETFVKNGSDRTFRQLIFELVGLFNQMKRHSDQFARYIGRNNAQFHLMML